ncbi:MAG: hypothetical protein PSN46_10350 [Gammaproteobacteria bacterium]|nr:hypothetical protein [Gammaproteobacteria bacterium]
MQTNQLPYVDWQDCPTQCCPRFKPESWQDATLHLDDMLFVKFSVRSIFHIPLNMGGVFTRVLGAIDKAGAKSQDAYLTLSHDPSLWRSEHYMLVTKEVPGETMVRLSGDFVSQVYEGPFSHMGKWSQALTDFVKQKGMTMVKPYFFYSTCPKCAKHYGKNYVVGIAQVKSIATQSIFQ